MLAAALNRVDAVHVCGLASRLNQQRHDGEFCDVMLEVAGRTLPTHSCVLSACSPYFRQLIVSDRPHPQHLLTSGGGIQQIVLDVPGLSDDVPDEVLEGALEAVSSLLDFVYTGRIELKDCSVDLVVKLAEVLALEGLAALGRSYRDKLHVLEQSDDEPILHDSDIEDTPYVVRTVVASQTAKRKRSSGIPVMVKLEEVDCASPAVSDDDGELAVAVERRRRGRKRRRTSARSAAVLLSTEGGDCGTGAGGEDDDLLEFSPSSRTTYTCRECGFSSDERQAIREHRMIHNGKSYVCRDCDFITIKASKLVSHLLSSEHPDTVMCSLCRFTADTPQDLRDHVKRHDHAEPFFCEQCELRFRTRSTLTIHVAKHSPDTPFACPSAGCPRAFKLKRSLQAHMISHSGQKCHMCEHCGYRTAYKSSFNSHVLMHTGAIFKCPQEGCSFRSIRKKNLKDHILTHALQKPFQCEICGQNFSYEQSLKRHAKMHSVDKNMLSCDFCPFTSIRRDKLREHVRKHHKDGQQIPDPVEDIFNML